MIRTSIARLRLIETYFSFDPAQYNQLFDDELRKGFGVIPGTSCCRGKNAGNELDSNT